MMRSIRLYCKYVKGGIVSAIFPFTAVLFALVMLLSVWNEFGPSKAGVFYFQRFAYGTTVNFLMIICTIPSALQLCREWKSSFFMFTRSRCGSLGYASALVFSSATVAFVVAFIGGVLFVIAACFKAPLVSEQFSNLENCIEAYANGGLMGEGRYLLYYFLAIAAQSALCALMSGFAVFASTVFTDSFMTAVSPMVVYIFITNFMSIIGLPPIVNPYFIYSTLNFNHRLLSPNQSYNFSILSCLYPYIYMIILLLILVFLVHISMKRKYERREV